MFTYNYILNILSLNSIEDNIVSGIGYKNLTLIFQFSVY